ncbi:hypothetical protein [Arthrobacter sp. CG_A4]|uniref:hypothetical protein n=1 Tax=Arthrobacter sp. CG_A4 TaxID=3071706 RepID=UPI002E06EAF8|nr:hypothetical protein [Arthrobacter sp. CG_A4]
MELRDITRETSLLKSYKTTYVDNQNYQLLRMYRDKGRQFPILTEHVFSLSGSSPEELIDYKLRRNMDDADAGRFFVLERTDNLTDKAKTRLFLVWVSPTLVEQFKSDPSNAPRVKANVIFHPRAGLENYPTYWNGGIEPVQVPNFLELGIRYLCKEKHVVAQHFCAVAKPRPPGAAGVDNPKSSLAVMVVVPVSSATAFASLGNPLELEDALRHITKRCYEGVTAKLIPATAVTLERVAVSGYSRSGVVLRTLLDNARANEPFMRNVVKEFYAFDVMLNENDPQGLVVKTKKQGYDEFWSKLTAWQGDDSDKKIRLYSAEPATVGSIYGELQTRLKKYGGGYQNKVGFSSFNGKMRRDGSGKYANLSDGYEIYSTDGSRSLAVMPSGNALIYLSSDNLVNPDGFAPGGTYEPGLEGHSWFISRLLSHAVFHSGF